MSTPMKSKLLRHFTVDGDRDSSEWHGEPVPSGDWVNADEWAKRQDTDDEHYDTFERGGDETLAVTIYWKD